MPWNDPTRSRVMLSATYARTMHEVMVLETLSDNSCHIVCLQETKLQLVDPFLAASIAGHRLRGFAQRPALGTKGGILILWDQDVVDLSNIEIRPFSLSATVTSKRGQTSWVEMFPVTMVTENCWSAL